MKKNLLVIVFIVAALIGNLYAGQTVDKQSLKKTHGIVLPKYSNGKDESVVIPITEKEAKSLINNKVDIYKFLGTTGILDTLEIPGEDDGDPYFGGGAGDSMCVFFSPGAGCKILKVGCNIGYNGTETAADANMVDGVYLSLHYANYNGESEPGGSGKYKLGTWTEGAWVPTEWYAANYPKSPVGERFWGEFPITPVNEPAETWEEVDMTWLGEPADNMGKDFVVMFVPFGGAADAACGFEDWQNWSPPAPYRLWKYYITDDTWYLRHQVSFAVYCVVEFYENTPPVLTAGGPWATVLSSDAKTLDCHIADIDANDEAQAGVASASLLYKINDGDVQTVAMTLASGTDTDGQWEAVVPAGVMNPGDVLTWSFEATDKAGLTGTSVSGSYGYFAKTSTLLLFYNDDGTSYPASIILSPYYDNRWVYADGNPVEYDVWVGADDGPLSAALIDQYDDMVILEPYSPATLNDDVLGAWFATGPKNLYWSSQEWAGQFIGNWTDDTTFAADDWHNMYMGLETVGGAGHDIATDPFPIVPVAGDPISGDLATYLADSLTLYINTEYELGWDNWSDAVTPNSNAVVCFTDSAEGRAMGIHNENNGTKTVFLGFDPLVLDTAPGYHWTEPNVSSLVGNSLLWFGLTSAVEETDGSNVVESYNLSQNYPNPFNPETSINYTISKSGLVKLSIYNVLGQKITELVNKNQTPGTYNISWNAKGCTSGVYFYRLETNDYSKTMKMMLLQ